MRFITSVLISSSIILATSCVNTGAPQRLDHFVDNAELKSDSYTPEDWERSALQFERLCEEYTSSGKNYTEAEKQMAAKAMGRYHSLLIKNGIESATSFLKEFGSLLPSYLDGLKQGIESNSESIGNSLEKLIDEEKIEKSLEELSESIEKIMDNIDESQYTK